MIATVIRLLADLLGAYIMQNKREGDPIEQSDILPQSIASVEQNGGDDYKDKIILTLINIEQENALKNSINYQRNSNGGIDYANPPVFLNLYLLFSVTFSDQQQDAYERALQRLSLIVEYFQAKSHFDVKSALQSSVLTDEYLDESTLNQLDIHMELHTLSFEQINYLWGSLGGKQVPFVMYRVRMVRIQKRITEEAAQVNEILLDQHPTKPN